VKGLKESEISRKRNHAPDMVHEKEMKKEEKIDK